MRYELRVTAYDLMDMILVSVTLEETTKDDPPRRRIVLSEATYVQGRGESDPSAWVRSVVQALAQNLPQGEGDRHSGPPLPGRP